MLLRPCCITAYAFCLFAMKCEGSIRLINEAFTCNVLNSDLIETSTQLLHSALTTQNTAGVPFALRRYDKRPVVW